MGSGASGRYMGNVNESKRLVGYCTNRCGGGGAVGGAGGAPLGGSGAEGSLGAGSPAKAVGPVPAVGSVPDELDGVPGPTEASFIMSGSAP